MIAFAAPEPDDEIDLHSVTDDQLIAELQSRFDELVVIGRQDAGDNESGMLVTKGCQLRLSAMLQMAADGVFEGAADRYWFLAARTPPDDEEIE